VVDGELTHDGSSVLARHILNARRRESRSGIQIAKEHPESPRKIDAAVAAVLAWQCRVDAVAKGLGKKKTRSGRVVVLR
jgi:phage terminase large subunit-like protein